MLRILGKALLIGLCIGAGLSGCKKHGRDGDVVEKAPLADKTSFSRLRAEYGNVIDALSSHPDASRVIDELVAAAESEPWCDQDDARIAIMNRFPNDKLSLFLLESLYEDWSQSKPAEARQFLSDVRGSAPDSKVAAKAAFLDLELEQTKTEREYLSRCEYLLEEHKFASITAIVLYHRINYRIARGLAKDAVVDVFRLWAAAPEFVNEKRLASVLCGVMRQAGYLIESETFARGPRNAEHIARFIVEEFSGMQNNELFEDYYQHTPQLGVLGELYLDDSVKNHDLVVYQLRMGFLALRQMQLNTTVRYLEDAVASLESPAETVSSLNTAAGSAVTEMLLTFLSSMVDVYGKDSYVHFSPAETLQNRRKIVGTIRKGCSAIRKFSAKEEDIPLETRQSVMGRCVEILASMDDHRGVVEFYQEQIAHEADETYRYAYWEQLGDYYLSPVKSYTEAASAYRQAVELAPNARAKVQVILKEVNVLMKQENYFEAYDALTSLIASTPESPLLSSAYFMSAICEASLGMRDLATTHMHDIAERFPNSAAAPEALLWLANAHIMTQEYESAVAFLKEIVDRYPGEQVSLNARGILDNLEQLGVADD